MTSHSHTFFYNDNAKFIDNQYVYHISLSNTFQFQTIDISSKMWPQPSKLLENALQIVGLQHDLRIKPNILVELCETYFFPMS